MEKRRKKAMAKKGDWVRIHSVVLKADDRTAKLPDDTKKCDFEMWTKGSLLEDEAKIGDVVSVETAVGRVEKGVLLEENPHYTHSYGNFVPEIIEIDKILRGIMKFGGEE
jgi:2-amino-4-ketopentanoate thiolase alpha subunit